jgi:hypothetical protein
MTSNHVLICVLEVYNAHKYQGSNLRFAEVLDDESVGSAGWKTRPILINPNYIVAAREREDPMSGIGTVTEVRLGADVGETASIIVVKGSLKELYLIVNGTAAKQ